MNAGGSDFLQRQNASYQFAFERALIVHLFLKIGDSEIGPVENLEPDAAAFRKSFAGQLNSNFGQLFRRHTDSPAVFGKFIGNLHALQFGNDALRFGRIDVGIQDLVADLVDEVHHGPGQDDDESRRKNHCQLLLQAVTRKEGLNVLDDR